MILHLAGFPAWESSFSGLHSLFLTQLADSPDRLARSPICRSILHPGRDGAARK